MSHDVAVRQLSRREGLVFCAHHIICLTLQPKAVCLDVILRWSVSDTCMLTSGRGKCNVPSICPMPPRPRSARALSPQAARRPAPPSSPVQGEVAGLRMQMEGKARDPYRMCCTSEDGEFCVANWAPIEEKKEVPVSMEFGMQDKEGKTPMKQVCQGHYGPATGIHRHPQAELSDYYLRSRGPASTAGALCMCAHRVRVYDGGLRVPWGTFGRRVTAAARRQWVSESWRSMRHRSGLAGGRQRVFPNPRHTSRWHLPQFFMTPAGTCQNS